MKKSKLNPLSLLSILGLLGILGFFTENKGWYGFFGWFSWISYYKYPVDERFKRNISKAGLFGFYISLLCFMTLFIIKTLVSSEKIFNTTLGLSFILLTSSFLITFLYYEKKGE